MADRSTSAADQVLLDLCRVLAGLHAGRRMQWASHADVARRLPQLTTAQLDAAIAVAVERGWVQGDGTAQPHSLLLTAAGRHAAGV